MEIPDYHRGLGSAFCTPYPREQASNTDTLETKSPAPKSAFELHQAHKPTYTIYTNLPTPSPNHCGQMSYSPVSTGRQNVRLEDSECIFPGSERAELVTPHSEGKSGSGRQYRTKGPALPCQGTISPGSPMRNRKENFGTGSWSTDVSGDSTRDDVTWLLSRQRLSAACQVKPWAWTLVLSPGSSYPTLEAPGMRTESLAMEWSGRSRPQE